MFLRRTSACTEFRERLGQANHLLITILIGIEGVRTGEVKKSCDFHTTWNPRSLEESAQRSRRFARDAMLNHVVDSLGVYLSHLQKSPFQGVLPCLHSCTDRALKSRLDAFCDDLALQAPTRLALVHLAIQWRNRRLHTGAENKIEQKYKAALMDARDEIREQFSGLDIDVLLSRFEMSETPRFKEVASLVKGALDFVQAADALVVQRLDPSEMALHIIVSTLKERAAMNRRRAGQQWGNTPVERRRRITGVLATAGFVMESGVECEHGLPDDFIANLARLSYGEVAKELQIDLPAS